MGLEDTNFVVTGATGWLGRASLGVLESLLGAQFPARVQAYASKAGATLLQSGRSVPYRALDDIAALPRSRRYVFLHCAFLGKERVSDLPLADFLKLNEAISEKVCAAARTVEAAGFFVPSSGAVYGRDRVLADDIEKNPYGVMKLRDEARFSELADALHCPLVIARVFNVAGPYINKTGAYALGSILEDALQHRVVRLRAAKPVIRSYVHVNDLIRLVLGILENSASGKTLFDTVGETEIEVGDLARLALTVLGQPDGIIERPPLDPDAPEDRYVGDRTALAALLVQRGMTLQPLSQQILDTAEFLRIG